MGVGDNLMLKFDQTVVHVFGQWDIYTTGLFLFLIGLLTYLVTNTHDPDAHPMLLARQAQASPVRQEGESAVFRCHSAPHGVPLSSGLNVKDPGDSKWARGRDGDLRDVWRKVVTGPVNQEDKLIGVPGKIMTVLGTENVVQHKLSDITRQINLIGQNIKQNGGKNVAIYLPNSVELLATLFACAYYDMTTILVPYDQPINKIIEFLVKSKADTVVAAVGSFPFDVITKSYPALKQLIWVVDDGSKHMDWNEIPTGTGGAVNVSTWQDIIQDQDANAGSELPVPDRNTEAKSILAFWPTEELVEYTQANIVAGISGQLTSIPSVLRITHNDLLLPADSLTSIYPLILTLAALSANASLALNSASGQSPNLVIASQGIAPTIIVTSSGILAKTHADAKAKMNSGLYQFVHWLQTRMMVQQGIMPLSTTLSRLYDSLRPVIGTTPGKLRLIYVSEQAGAESAPISAETLSDTRIYLGARTIYALSAPKVAGAVTQTGPYDYRLDGTDKYSHFGVPVTSVEIFLRDTQLYKTTDSSSSGEIIARGPAVVGGEAALGINGKINIDHTVSLI